jgi:hypothetical protein
MIEGEGRAGAVFGGESSDGIIVIATKGVLDRDLRSRPSD